MVYSVDVYNKEWKKIDKVDFNGDVFNDENINDFLIHEYYLLQMANWRNPIAHTKTRWEVRWSWKKIYKQKWTWNARAWEKRSPIRVGWWVAFWPRNERVFKKKMTKKSRRKALCWLITSKLKWQNVLWCDIDVKEYNKTKNIVSLLKNMWLSSNKVLFVLWNKNWVLEKSIRNIENVKYLLVDYLNPVDLLSYDKVLFVKNVLDNISKWDRFIVKK